jgi:hypothetical protein
VNDDEPIPVWMVEGLRPLMRGWRAWAYRGRRRTRYAGSFGAVLLANQPHTHSHAF